jgi:hypothetical protein
MIHCVDNDAKEASHGRNPHTRSNPDTAGALGDATAVTRAARVGNPTRVTDSRPIAAPGGTTANGDGPMMIPSAVGDRSSGKGLPAELTKALVSLWTLYAGKAPSRARTEIRGNVVTCMLVDAVRDFNQSTVAPQTGGTVQGVAKLTPAAYKRDAVAAVVRLTRQRVASFVSSHDRDTDVATEVFTLEPSLSRGAPPSAKRRSGEDFRLFRARVI